MVRYYKNMFINAATPFVISGLWVWSSNAFLKDKEYYSDLTTCDKIRCYALGVAIINGTYYFFLNFDKFSDKLLKR